MAKRPHLLQPKMTQTQLAERERDLFDSLTSGSDSENDRRVTKKQRKEEPSSSSQEELENAYGWFNGEQPFLFKPSVDGYLVDRRDDDKKGLYAVSDEPGCFFARDIRSLQDGAVISKHSAPYGKSYILRHERFLLVKKFFSPDGKIGFVLIKDTKAPFIELILESLYFFGWSEEQAIKTFKEDVKK